MEDILIDDQFNLLFSGGDFATGESTQQHQQLLLVSAKGDWRENPISGVGIKEFLKDVDDAGILPEIKFQFEKDGMQVNDILVKGDDFYIDANYK